MSFILRDKKWFDVNDLDLKIELGWVIDLATSPKI